MVTLLSSCQDAKMSAFANYTHIHVPFHYKCIKWQSRYYVKADYGSNQYISIRFSAWSYLVLSALHGFGVISTPMLIRVYRLLYLAVTVLILRQPMHLFLNPEPILGDDTSPSCPLPLHTAPLPSSPTPSYLPSMAS